MSDSRTYTINGKKIHRYEYYLPHLALTLNMEVTGSASCLSQEEGEKKLRWLLCRLEDWDRSTCNRRFDDAVWAMGRAAADLYMERFGPKLDVFEVRRMLNNETLQRLGLKDSLTAFKTEDDDDRDDSRTGP